MTPMTEFSRVMMFPNGSTITFPTCPAQDRINKLATRAEKVALTRKYLDECHGVAAFGARCDALGIKPGFRRAAYRFGWRQRTRYHVWNEWAERVRNWFARFRANPRRGLRRIAQRIALVFLYALKVLYYIAWLMLIVLAVASVIGAIGIALGLASSRD